MSAARYVATADLKDALRGRETELIDVLGIAWRSGQPHIHCPYTEHTDANPSWRWDEPHARAHCSCGAQDALGVARKVLGLDFEATKVRVAELLRRDDLICGKTGSSGQRTDTQSLMSAKPKDCDDSLPIQYLAHRLNVEPKMVPRPTTP